MTSVYLIPRTEALKLQITLLAAPHDHSRIIISTHSIDDAHNHTEDPAK